LNSIAAQCPLRSNREELSMSTCFPLCARTRTLLDAVGMSQKCHFRTHPARTANSITDRSSHERARLICVWIPIGMRPL
jgi:hypothetical protein